MKFLSALSKIIKYAGYLSVIIEVLEFAHDKFHQLGSKKRGTQPKGDK